MSSFTIIASAVLFLSSTFAYTPTNKYIKSSQLNLNPPQSAYNPKPSGNILAVLKENGLTTFVDLIIQAGLEETFSQPRPFIVWAPTNEAFAAIGRETLNSILDDANLLKDILTYHLALFLQPYTLIPSIKDQQSLPTVQGEIVRINVYRKKGSSFASERTVTVNGALVVNALPAGDSIIYVIDRVLNPQDLNIRNTQIAYLRRNPEFSIFLSIYDILGIIENSSKIRMKTVFAPTNAAFLALPDGELEALFANERALVILLNTHIASGAFYSRGLVSGPLPVFSGVNIEVNVTPGGITVGNAKIIKADISTFDVVIHVIDTVISSSAGNSSISSEFENDFFKKYY